jgi:hypothetical protein
MIESWEQWFQFISTSINDDLLLHVIPLHDNVHSARNSPCLLFIRNLSKGKTYYYGFNHPDIKTPKPVDHQSIIDTLDQLQGIKWAVDKKAFSHLIPIKETYDVGMIGYLSNNKILELSEFDTPAHSLIRRNFSDRPDYGKLVPLTKHLESFSELAEVCEKSIKKMSNIGDSFKQFNRLIIEPLAEVESQGLAINPAIFREHFGDICINSGKVYTQYNVYTATGRPSNRFGGINYAALNKEDGSRKAFISRFGDNGKLILIDYSAFHPRIVSLLTHYPISTSIDIYEYLATLYFNKKEVDETDIANAKQITFRQFFGGVQSEYAHIKYLAHLKDFIDYHWGFFNQYGYVETPLFKRRISNKHVKEPKPATIFNYIMQAVEGEISIPVLGMVNNLLRNKRSKCVLYTYDSFLIDYCLDDGNILTEIREEMSLDGKFPTKVYMGDNYHDMDLIV